MKIVSYILLIIGALVSGGPVGCDVCDPESEPPKKPVFYGVVRDAITGDPIPDVLIDNGDLPPIMVPLPSSLSDQIYLPHAT